MAAKKKQKPTKKQISTELQRAAHDYVEFCHVLHKQALWNVASHLKMAPEELEEEWGELT